MDRRNFSKKMMIAGLSIPAAGSSFSDADQQNSLREDARKYPTREFDVVVAGGGTHVDKKHCLLYGSGSGGRNCSSFVCIKKFRDKGTFIWRPEERS